MSDLQGNLNLKPIIAPSLTQPNYGKNIREKFDNIDDNFRRLANRDFVAGKAGNDVKFATYKLWKNGNLTIEGRAFVEAIIGDESPIIWSDVWSNGDFTNEFYENHISLKPVNNIKFFDYIKDNPTITVMYQLIDHESPDESANRHKLCSPYVYTFIDKRYAILGEWNDNPDEYAELEDCSCLLNLIYEESSDPEVSEEDKWIPKVTRINQFPTLYYDGKGQFRWKLYGSESGILATGPKGRDADSNPILFANLASRNNDNNSTNNSRESLEQILVVSDDSPAEWVDVRNLTPDQLPVVGTPVIAYRSSGGASDVHPISRDGEVDTPYTMYFTRVVNVNSSGANNVVQVDTSASTSIQFLVNSTIFEHMLSSLRIGGMGTACLFIPSVDVEGSSVSGEITSDTPVHAAYGTIHIEGNNRTHILTLKPIFYSEILEPANSKGISDTSRLEIAYNNIVVRGKLESMNGAIFYHRGAAIMKVEGGASGAVGITGGLTTDTLKVTGKSEFGNEIKIGDNSNSIKITTGQYGKISMLTGSTEKTTISRDGITTVGNIFFKKDNTVKGSITHDGSYFRINHLSNTSNQGIQFNVGGDTYGAAENGTRVWIYGGEGDERQVGISPRLYVNGKASVAGILNVGGELNVTGSANFSDKITVWNQATLKSDVIVGHGAAEGQGILKACRDLEAWRNVTIGGTLKFSKIGDETSEEDCKFDDTVINAGKIGTYLNISNENISQLEDAGFIKLIRNKDIIVLKPVTFINSKDEYTFYIDESAGAFGHFLFIRAASGNSYLINGDRTTTKQINNHTFSIFFDTGDCIDMPLNNETYHIRMFNKLDAW